MLLTNALAYLPKSLAPFGIVFGATTLYTMTLSIKALCLWILENNNIQQTIHSMMILSIMILSITILSIMILSIMILSIIILSITTLSIKTFSIMRHSV